jgi:membrane protein implicated in regulation of membrane protease activity
VVLLAVYTAEFRRLRPDQDCDCFGPKLTTDRAGALRRNLALLLVSAAALFALLTGAVPVASLSQAVVGTALLLLAAMLALVALQRLRVWTTQRQSLPQRTQQASPPPTDPGRKGRVVRA